jgi:acetylornithine deacetylase/succinyl-diaminopimelate desuccinylase-like protein
MSASEALPAVLDRIDRDLDASLDRLFALLRIQSVSTDPAYAPQCRAAAEHVAADLRSLGLETSVRPTEGHPVVVGKANGQADGGKAPRILFYGHYDVQPVDPLNLWKTPPFEPRIENLADGRKIIVARGACDDKGQAMTFVEACRAFKAVTGKLPLDITMMIEGEEECGSKHLFGFVRENAAEFRRDLALVCDTGMWDADTPSITTSLRGLVYEEVRLTCADRDLHSGLFGGAARNPIHVLADVLSALHKPDGSVAIPGFYDGVRELPPDIKADLAGLDLTPEKFLGQVGLKIPAGEKDRMVIEQVSTRPTAEVNGIIGGYTGEGAKTVIPGKAMAKVSFRLVGAQDPEKIRSAFRDFVRGRRPVALVSRCQCRGADRAVRQLLPDPSPAGLAPLGYRPSRRACRDAGGHDQRQWRAPRETAENARRPARRARRQARRHQGDGDLAYPSRPYRQCRAVPAGHALCSERRIRMAGRRRRAALQSQSPGDLARGRP